MITVFILSYVIQTLVATYKLVMGSQPRLGHPYPGCDFHTYIISTLSRIHLLPQDFGY
jgi:hypothetical protein